jgi:uncharacterized repeat protein (TIGR03803 family)
VPRHCAIKPAESTVAKHASDVRPDVELEILGDGLPNVLTTLLTFTGANGANPSGSLAFDGQGNILGTTQQGGVANLGIAYSVTLNGQPGPSQSFKGMNGSCPCGIVFDPFGNVYGVAASGGKGFGLVFCWKWQNPGAPIIPIYPFKGPMNDGSEPVGLTSDSVGNLYGATLSGGKNNLGTLFKIGPPGVWTETILHNFRGGRHDGANPNGGLVLDNAGNLWGTTQYGGQAGAGVVFQWTPGGGLNPLTSFPWPGQPLCGVVFHNSVLYGSTAGGWGTVYKLPPPFSTPALVTLQAFGWKGPLGNGPCACPLFDTPGNLYGTTGEGGVGSVGTVFRSVGGHFAPLHSFSGPDGAGPTTFLLQEIGKTVFVYGITFTGGPANTGTLFRLDIP